MEQKKIADDDLRESVRLIKEDVVALETTVKGQKTPWYKNVSTLISLLAFLLSFGTAYFSYTRAKEQDMQNTRGELRGLLQRLAVLPREYYEIPSKYPNDRSVIGFLRSNINQENSFLSIQAAELAKKLPRNAVSATEWYSIAMGLAQDFNYDLAKEFLGYALECAKGFNDKTAVLRGNAQLMFNMGKSGPGRVEYQRALNIFSDFEGYDEDTQNRTHAQTWLNWAYSEAKAGFKDEANQCLTKSESYISKLQPGPDVKEWKDEIAAARNQINFTGDKTDPSVSSASPPGPVGLEPPPATAPLTGPQVKNSNSQNNNSQNSYSRNSNSRGASQFHQRNFGGVSGRPGQGRRNANYRKTPPRHRR